MGEDVEENIMQKEHIEYAKIKQHAIKCRKAECV